MTDWLQAVIGALAVMAGVLIGSVVLLVLALIAGGLDGLPAFQVVLLFASMALGADVRFESPVGFFEVSALAVPLVAGTMLLARIVVGRFGGPIAADTHRIRAFAVKLAFVTALLAVAVTKLASIGFRVAVDFSVDEYFGDDARFAPSAGKAFLVTLVLVSVAALCSRHRAAMGVLASTRVRQFAAPARLAVSAYAITASVTLAAAVIYSLSVADEVTFKAVVGVGVALVCFGGTIAGGMVASSLGAPVTWATADTSRSAHVFSSDASFWVKLVLLVAPIAVASLTWRHLKRVRPTAQADLVRLAAATGGFFAALCALGAVISNATLLGGGSSGTTDLSAQADVSYNVLVVAVLGLVWGWVGSFGAAAVWGKQHGMPLIVAASPSVPAPLSIFEPEPEPEPEHAPAPTPLSTFAPAPPAAPAPESTKRPTLPRRDIPPPDPTTRRD